MPSRILINNLYGIVCRQILNSKVGFTKINRVQSKLYRIEVESLRWKQFHSINSNSRRLPLAYITL